MFIAQSSDPLSGDSVSITRLFRRRSTRKWNRTGCKGSQPIKKNQPLSEYLYAIYRTGQVGLKIPNYHRLPTEMSRSRRDTRIIMHVQETIIQYCKSILHSSNCSRPPSLEASQPNRLYLRLARLGRPIMIPSIRPIRRPKGHLVDHLNLSFMRSFRTRSHRRTGFPTSIDGNFTLVILSFFDGSNQSRLDVGPSSVVEGFLLSPH